MWANLPSLEADTGMKADIIQDARVDERQSHVWKKKKEDEKMKKVQHTQGGARYGDVSTFSFGFVPQPLTKKLYWQKY